MLFASMHPVLLGFKPAPPFVCSLLALSVLLGLCYGSGLLLSTAVGFVSPKAAVFGFQVFGVWSLAWVIANTDFDGMVSVLVCTLSLPSIRSLLFSCRCDS